MQNCICCIYCGKSLLKPFLVLALRCFQKLALSATPFLQITDKYFISTTTSPWCYFSTSLFFFLGYLDWSKHRKTAGSFTRCNLSLKHHALGMLCLECSVKDTATAFGFFSHFWGSRCSSLPRMPNSELHLGLLNSCSDCHAIGKINNNHFWSYKIPFNFCIQIVNDKECIGCGTQWQTTPEWETGFEMIMDCVRSQIKPHIWFGIPILLVKGENEARCIWKLLRISLR